VHFLTYWSFTIVLTLPVASASAERTFSVMRRVMTHLTEWQRAQLSNPSMFPHYRAVSISTPVHSFTLGLPCRSLWPPLWAHLWCNPDWTTPTPFCMKCLHLTCTNYSLPRISLTRVVLPSLRHLSARERLTGFLSTTECGSKSLHSPIRPWQHVNHLISTISSNYTSHHELSVLQASNYSKYHILILVGAPWATTLLQHGIPFLLPLKTVRPYIVSSSA